jgi:phenylacetate-CoA ligase
MRVFNEKQYIEMLKKGRKKIAKNNYGLDAKKLMLNNWTEIVNFSKQSYKEIQCDQLKKISELVDYAYINIPLYRKKYDEINYRVGDIKTWKDFEKLPILYKEELIDGFPFDITEDIDNFIFSTRSSGSSGKFVTLAVSLEAILIDTIQGVRQFMIQSNYDYNEDDTILFIYTCPWWIQDIDGKYKQHFLPTTTKVDLAIKKIKKLRPKIISTYPTYLEKISSTNIKLSDYNVKYVIVHSEQSSSKQRKLLSEKLGVQVLDEYSSEELTRIALECTYNIYHLEEDACYIELLDPITNEKVEYGKEGIVVGTNLINKATPIIRYYQGDLAVINSPRDCPCGSNARTMEMIKGRYMDSIITNTGEIIPASSFMDIAYNWFLDYNIPLQGLRYQFIQIDIDLVELYLVKGFYELDIKIIKDSVYLLLPKSMKLVVKEVDVLPKFKGNKYRPVISLVKKGK